MTIYHYCIPPRLSPIDGVACDISWIIVRCLDNTLESLIKREKDIASY